MVSLALIKKVDFDTRGGAADCNAGLGSVFDVHRCEADALIELIKAGRL